MIVDFCHLVGLGGTGGALVEPLARLLRFHRNAGPNTELTLWDGDKFEEHNAERQIGARDGVNKALAASDRLPWVDGQKLGKFIPRYFDERDAAKVASDRRPGLVILAVDNFMTRRKLLEALVDRRSPLLVVLPGNEAIQGSLLCQSYPPKPLGDRVSRELHDSILDFHPEIAQAHDGVGGGPGCTLNQTREPQTIAANFTAAALVLWAVTNWLDDQLVPPTLTFDVRRGEVSRA